MTGELEEKFVTAMGPTPADEARDQFEALMGAPDILGAFDAERMALAAAQRREKAQADGIGAWLTYYGLRPDVWQPTTIRQMAMNTASPLALTPAAMWPMVGQGA